MEKSLGDKQIVPIFAASNVCLAIRVESREGKTSPTLPIYSYLMGGYIFIFLSKYAIKS